MNSWTLLEREELRPHWQRFEPREVEDVVIAAAEELDAAIAGLRGGEVATISGPLFGLVAPLRRRQYPPMPTMGATLTDLIELPAELSAKARAVPGLQERLLRFTRMEVAMNEQRQQRYRPEARAVLHRARELVEKRKAEGTDRAEAMRAFEQNFSEITEAL